MDPALMMSGLSSILHRSFDAFYDSKFNGHPSVLCYLQQQYKSISLTQLLLQLGDGGRSRSSTSSSSSHSSGTDVA